MPGMARAAANITLASEEEAELRRLARTPTTPQQTANRSGTASELDQRGTELSAREIG